MYEFDFWRWLCCNRNQPYNEWIIYISSLSILSFLFIIGILPVLGLFGFGIQKNHCNVTYMYNNGECYASGSITFFLICSIIGMSYCMYKGIHSKYLAYLETKKTECEKETELNFTINDNASSDECLD